MKVFKDVSTIEEIRERAENVETMEQGNEVRMGSVYANALQAYRMVCEILDDEDVADHPPQFTWASIMTAKALFHVFEHGDREDQLILLVGSILAPLMKLISDAEQSMSETDAIEQMIRRIAQNDEPGLADFNFEEPEVN